MPLLTILRYTLSTLIDFIQVLLLLKIVLTWFPQERIYKFTAFINMITEPVLIPFRALLSRIRGADRFPFDMSIYFAIIALMLLSLLFNA